MNGSGPAEAGPAMTAASDHAKLTAAVDELAADVAAVLGAFDNGFTVGFAAGLDAGWAAARLRAAQHDVAGGLDWKALASSPPHAGLERLRALDDRPCRPGGCGRCSRCIRAAAVERNGGDFLGARVDTRGAA